MIRRRRSRAHCSRPKCVTIPRSSTRIGWRADARNRRRRGSRVIRAALQIMALCFPGPANCASRHGRKSTWTAAVDPPRRTNEDAPRPSNPLAPPSRGDPPRTARHHWPWNACLPRCQALGLALERKHSQRGAPAARYEADEMTSHGFRTIASTLLNESASGAQTPSSRPGPPGQQRRQAAYARGEYWDERVRMARWWRSPRCASNAKARRRVGQHSIREFEAPPWVEIRHLVPTGVAGPPAQGGRTSAPCRSQATESGPTEKLAAGGHRPHLTLADVATAALWMFRARRAV